MIVNLIRCVIVLPPDLVIVCADLRQPPGFYTNVADMNE